MRNIGKKGGRKPRQTFGERLIQAMGEVVDIERGDRKPPAVRIRAGSDHAQRLLETPQSSRDPPMSTISLRLPESLHRKARDLAEREGISINQLVATALAEKISALLTGEYLAERAARGNRRGFERVLRKVRARNAEPVAGD